MRFIVYLLASQERTNKMKITKIATFTAAALVAGGVFAEEAAAPAAVAEQAPAVEAKAADEVSVIIGGTVKIMKSEIDAQVAKVTQYSEKMGRPIPATELPKVRQNIIEGYSMQKALELAADKAGVTATDEDVEAFISEQLPEGVAFDDMVKSQGEDPVEVRKQLKETMKIEKFLKTQVPAIEVTDDDAKKMFDEIVAKNGEDCLNKPESVTASHILLKCTDEDSEAKKAEIIKLRERILAGEKFADVAAASDCPSKANGGSLGEFGRGQMVPEFEVAAFTQEIGKVGEPVKTKYGWHIILVEARTEGGKITFDEVKDGLKQQLKMQKESEAVNGVIEKIKKEANIQILEKAVESAPVTPESARELPVWAK